MEKISGILPGSARVKAVDLREAAPVRPGTPSFGRPEGISSLKLAADKAAAANALRESQITSKFSTAARAAELQSKMTDWRSKDAQQAAIAAQISDSFFIRNQKVEPEMNMEQVSTNEEFNMPAIRALDLGVSSSPSGFKTDAGGSFEATASMRPGSFSTAPFDDVAEESTIQQPEGLYPKGSFIDRTA